MVADLVHDVSVTLETSGVICMWVAVILRAPVAVRVREQRALWIAVMLAATAISLHLEWVNLAIYSLTGPTHLTALGRNIFGVFTCAAVLDFVFLAVRGRHTYPLYGLAGVVVIIISWLDLTAPPHLLHTISLTGSPEPSLPFWLILIAVNLATNVVCASACWSYSRNTEDEALRFGLLFFGSGGVFAGGYWLASAVNIQLRSAWRAAFLPFLLACYAFMRASAILVPLWMLTRLRIQRLRALLRLWPLWRDLIDAVPEVCLNESITTRRQFLWRFGPQKFRLYRTVIEIRDAMRTLRCYISQSTWEDIQSDLASTETTTGSFAARQTACWLRIAVQVKRTGVSEPGNDLVAPILGGPDMASEIVFLQLVAAEYNTSGITVLTDRMATHVALEGVDSNATHGR